jgi:hypothetical protein
MEPHDPLRALAQAGITTDGLTPGQRAALSSLAPDEVETLIRVKQQMDEHAPEVEAHSMVGGLFF